MGTFVQFVDAVAWPIAVLLIALLFRSELRSLLGRMTTLKYKELQAEFEKKLDSAEKEAKAISTNKAIDQKIYTNVMDYIEDTKSRLIRIAEVSTRAAIIEAWTELETAIHYTAKEKGMDEGKRVSMNQLIERLVEKGMISKKLLTLYNDLRALRNQVAHTREYHVTYSQAERYIFLAIDFAVELHSI